MQTPLVVLTCYGMTDLKRLTLAVLLVAAGCSGPRSTGDDTPPDQQFGHRYEDRAPDGRQTVTIGPASEGMRMSYVSAPFDSVTVRAAPPDAEQSDVQVEVLVKGAFPDGCMQLHSFEQQRTGHLITARLEARRPQGAVCFSVYRPYRFYARLDGLFGAGSYTLKLNGRAIAFQIRDTES